MRNVVRRIVAALVSGGVPLLAYWLLVPAVWSRGTLGWLQAVAAVSAVLALLHDGGSVRIGAWARFHLVFAIEALALFLAGPLTLSLILGEDVLTSTAQMVVYGLAVIVAVLSFTQLGWFARRGSILRSDPDRDARREAIRENVRREIAEIEQQARAARPDLPPAS